MGLSREELRDHPPLVMGSRFNARENSTESDEPADTGAADSGRTTTETDSQDTMKDPELPDDPTDEQKIDYLVSEDGPDLDRENMEPLEGTDCLGNIYEDYQRLNAAEAEEADGETGTETTETPEQPGGSGEETDDTEPAVTFETEDDFKSAVADVVDERENAQKKESLVDWIDSRSERYNAEMLDGTPKGVLEEIADDVAEEQRENAAVQTTTSQADRSPMRTDGPVRANAETDDLPPSSSDESYDAAKSGGDD